MTRTANTTDTEILAAYIRNHGPIGTVRVSSAQAKGRASQYSYWGAVRYELRVTQTGKIANMPCERASSDRRTYAGAKRDAEAIAESEGRIELDHIGTLADNSLRGLFGAAEWAKIEAEYVSRRAA